ncbi:MAG: MaoC family dehydratase [Ruminococcus flavefaciens]|nr:MaoC family dehydratase [Ruminococcus flavefaciens]
MRICDIKIGDFYEEAIVVSSEMVEVFAKVTGDDNPIHLDEEYANKSYFKKRILHGMLMGGFISKIIGMNLPGEGTIYLSQELKFLNPAYVGEEIIVRIEVIKKIMDTNRLVLKTVCKSLDGKILVDGTAMVLPPK